MKLLNFPFSDETLARLLIQILKKLSHEPYTEIH